MKVPEEIRAAVIILLLVAVFVFAIESTRDRGPSAVHFDAIGPGYLVFGDAMPGYPPVWELIIKYRLKGPLCENPWWSEPQVVCA